MLNEMGAVARRSPMIRLFTVGFLALLLQIPVILIAMLVSERRERRTEAVKEVSLKWGGTQSVTGPALVVPYHVRANEVPPGGSAVFPVASGRAVFLPERLELTGKLTPEIRHRGIFSIPVYTLSLETRGRFAPPDWAALGIDPADADWKDAYLAISIADTRAIQKLTDLQWGTARSPFLPSAGEFHGGRPGVHAPVPGPPGAQGADFAFSAVLNGTQGIYFAPFGKQTEVRLESSWPSPSFQGNWIPARRNITDHGFVAEWSISDLGRDFPQAWRDVDAYSRQADAARFGLDLMQSVDSYRMAERSVKYAILFLLLTLGSVWLAEILGRLLVHPIQYCLLGAALVLFYLLELALSEHLGFTAAYVIATAAIVVMVGCYGAVVLHSVKRAAWLGAGVAALYGYLYVVLTNEDDALLVGAIGLFVLLAAVMYVTRRVDWFRIEGPRGEMKPAA
ncbi:MAG TPA: cell envelope integrity protein CreD [Candidatus Eisenbacteria bacterium]|nr:cell envelope integrity protein CreD [Candidatus Eisenbacteria bacterium]